MLPINSNLQPKVSPTIALNQKVKELQSAGEDIINMSIGENRFPPPQELIDALKKYADRVTYSDPQGIIEFRKAIARYYHNEGLEVNEKHIVVTPGSKAGLFILMLALEGDLLLVRPSWVSYEPQARHTGKKVYWIETGFDNNHIPSATEIKIAFKKATKNGLRPKLIILNYPNNPTSYNPTEKELEVIVETCNELKLTIISDELYGELIYKTKKTNLTNLNQKDTIVVGGISKFLSVAGLRIGWIITPQTEEGGMLANILKALASDVWSNISTSIQYAVTEYLENVDYRPYIKYNKALHEQRNKQIYQEFKKMGLEVIDPKAGFYVYIDMETYREKLRKIGITSGIELQNYLLDNYKIAALSGVNFSAKADGLTLRMSTSFLDCNDSYKSDKLYNKYLSSNKNTFVNKLTHPELYRMIESMSKFVNLLKETK